MGWLVETALRLRVAVLALSILLIAGGLRLIPYLPLDVFPEFSPPYVEIQTEAPGLSAEEVENLVTFPLENALIGTPGLDTLRSKSVLGLSSIRCCTRTPTCIVPGSWCKSGWPRRRHDCPRSRVHR
jgi:Cu/Ag efflux pump CusA